MKATPPYIRTELKHPNAKYPKKANPSDTGFDVFATEDVTITSNSTITLDLGFRVQIPPGWGLQLRPRSGLGKRGLTCHPGTIDQTYRKNVGVIMHNLSRHPIKIKVGDRVAQLVLEKVWKGVFIEGKVQDTDRKGFGSTGK